MLFCNSFFIFKAYKIIMKKIKIATVFCFIGGFLFAQSLQSPDGNFEMNFQLKNGIPYYNLKYKNQLIVEDSKLGLQLYKDTTISFAKEIDTNDNTKNLNSGFVKVDEKKDSKKEFWKPILGEKKEYLNHYNELTVTLNQPENDRTIAIKFRLFDDGLGFRYEFPQQKNLNYFVVKEEDSEFDFPSDLKAWWITGDYDTQEYIYQTSNISEIPSKWANSYDSNASQTPIKNAVQSPVMLKKEGKNPIYINLAEAAVIGFPASHLEVNGKDFKLKTHLTPDAQGTKGYVQTPFHTPWRTIIVSEKAENILNSKMIFNLNEPTKYSDTSYIKPTKYIGVWWQMFVPGRGSWNYADVDNVHLGKTDYKKLTPNKTHAANNKNVKEYIDFASKHGFDAVLVEGWNEGWEDWFGKSKEYVFDFITPYPDFDIKMLNDYAHSKNVRLMMHHETSSSATNYERWLDKAFQLMNKYGYQSVKTGYVGNIIPRGEHHYSQWMIEHYIRVAEKANDYKIMVNSHESVRPTGLNRTYPNWIAAEAARGTEFEVFSGNPPEHTTILPFTRLMGGPMDYTPGIFQTKINYYDPKDTRFVKTTLAKQLALYITMYSPLQMAADLPENYEKHLDAFQFIKDVAVDWDDTKILAAEPGDFIHIARKAKGTNNWFVGGITDENARHFTVDFSFLDAGKKYEITVYEDGKDADYINNPQSYNIYKKTISNKTKLPIKLARSGGYAISIKPL